MKRLLFSLLIFVALSTQTVSATSTEIEVGTVLPRAELMEITWDVDTASEMIDGEPEILMEGGNYLVQTVEDVDVGLPPPAISFYQTAVFVGDRTWYPNLIAFKETDIDFWSTSCGQYENVSCGMPMVVRYIRTDHLTEAQRTVESIDGAVTFSYDVVIPNNVENRVQFTWHFDETPHKDGEFWMVPTRDWAHPTDSTQDVLFGIETHWRFLTLYFNDDLVIENGEAIEDDWVIEKTPYEYGGNIPWYHYWTHFDYVPVQDFMDIKERPAPTRPWYFFNIYGGVDFKDDYEEFSTYPEELPDHVKVLGYHYMQSYPMFSIRYDLPFTLTYYVPIEPQYADVPIPTTGLEPNMPQFLQSFLLNLGMYNSAGFMLMYFILTMAGNIGLVYIKMPTIVFVIANAVIFTLFVTMGIIPIYVSIPIFLLLLGFMVVILRRNLFPGGGLNE